jgi:outer membrane immunogenic protein
VNAGASQGKVKTDFNVAPVLQTNFVVTSSFPISVGSDTSSPDGFIGGGQIGYNWQWSPLIVVGLEADIQGALEKDSPNLSNPFSGVHSTSGTINTFTGTTVRNYTTEIDWFGTVRGRIGYVWGNGEVLSYLTGGLAYGEVKINGTNTVGGNVGPGIFPISVSQTFGHSQVNTGWVAGYGTEGVINFWGARNWTWKIEGLYMDLGHLDTTGVPSGSSVPAGFGVAGGQVTTHSHFTDGILRGGLNYRF